jgi:hypothetical protein
MEGGSAPNYDALGKRRQPFDHNENGAMPKMECSWSSGFSK